MVEPAVHELGQRAHRRTRGLRQIGIEVELELQPDEGGTLCQRREVGVPQLNRHRALRGHSLNSRLDDGPDRPLGAGVTQELLQQRDPGSLEALPIEGIGIRGRNMALAATSRFIRRVEAHRRIECDRQIPDRPRQRSTDILGG